MSELELRRFFEARDLRGIRKACGFSALVVTAALGVSRPALANWESRVRRPRGATGVRYARIVAGMERHLEVTLNSSDKGRNR